MDETDIILLVGGIVLFILLVVLFAVEIPKSIKEEELRRKKVEEEYEREPVYEFIPARVKEKRENAYYKTELRMPVLPELKKEFFVTFVTEQEEELTLPVREDCFVRLEEGQQGTLVTVNGNFFDFGDGEERTETEESVMFQVSEE